MGASPKFFDQLKSGAVAILLMLCLGSTVWAVLIGEAKTAGPGWSGSLQGIVTTVFADNDEFVIEAEDRSAGIAVTPILGALDVGNEVVVTGTIENDGMLHTSELPQLTGRTVTIAPLGVSNKNINGAVDNAGLSNQDLLVTTWGEVLDVPTLFPDGSMRFHVTDGSAPPDGPKVTVPFGGYQVAFEDNFDTGKKPEWLDASGTSSVLNNQLYTDGVAMVVAGGMNFNNVAVGVDGTTGAREIGILLRFQDTNNFLLPIWANDVLYYHEVVGGGYGGMQGAVSATGLGPTAHLEAKVEGSNLTSTITDGTNTYTTGGTVSSVNWPGTVGVFKNQGQQLYDNFRALTSTELPVDAVQVVIPASKMHPTEIKPTDHLLLTGIASKSPTSGGDIRAIKTRDMADVVDMLPQSDPVNEEVWPPQGALQRADLTRMGPGVGLRAACDGVPVYGFGHSYICGRSPDFDPRARLQANNDLEMRKIVPKKSWQINSSKIGATPPRLPRTARPDFQPFLGIYLIDGDPETNWACRGQNQPDTEPAWARIDLAKETQVDTIVIVPRDDNQGMPQRLTVRVSRDAWHWETVYDNPNQEAPTNVQPVNITFTRRPIKQVWVIGQNTRKTKWLLHTFSLAGVEVLDENGDNVALVTRGAGVTVSSFESFIASQRETHDSLWPVHYDLGVKWIRINYAGSVLNWRIVEREKGVYEIDPEADAAITQAVNNGCRIIFGLGFTNWLYTPEGGQNRKEEKQWFQTCELSVGLPGPNPEMLEAFKNFARFMVNKYKDRVDYFEIMNEESGGYAGWGNVLPEDRPAVYTQWVKEVSPVIKSEHPNAKVVLGSLSGLGPRREVGLDWLKACLDLGIAPYIDVIAWHGYYGVTPEDAAWNGFISDVQETKALAQSYGFNGEYMHTEWSMWAPYPPQNPEQSPTFRTEIFKAKHMARFAIMNLAQDVTFFWNETWADGHVDNDVGLFRNAFSSSPLSESQPQAAYYVLRTLCTAFEDARPEPMTVAFSNTQKTLECWTFRLPGGDRLVSVSLPGNSADQSPDYQTDISFPGMTFQQAVGLDVLNGKEQDLIVSQEQGGTVLRGILVKDYPIVIKLQG